MKILSASQIREADAYTIEHEPIASIDLMERAAGTCVEWMEENLHMGAGVTHLFCGTGNNGGDGLVIARKLAQGNFPVKVYLIAFSDTLSEDCRANLERLKNISIEPVVLKTLPKSIKIGTQDRIVDAIFGSGLSRPLSGWLKDLIQLLNGKDALRISIDIPSGLFADDNSENDLDAVFSADLTHGFQLPKHVFFHPTAGKFCGEWNILDIGLDQDFIGSQETSFEWLRPEELLTFYRYRQRFSHKGNYGHALIMAGSLGKIGAAVLAARACLRSGAGLLTVQSPRCGYDIIQNSVPEAMTFLSTGLDFITESPEDHGRFSALGAGPGLGTSQQTMEALDEMIRYFKGPMVFDADALNILSAAPEMLRFLPSGTILTPHPGEFKRLAGDWTGDKEGLEKLRSFCRNYRVITVLKGAYTAICDENGKVFFNSTGNPGMATGGSGDVLTGMITGLLARGYDPLQSAKLGVYLHGLAGDLAALDVGEESLIAGDLIRYLPAAFSELLSP